MKTSFNISNGTLTVTLNGELDEHSSHSTRATLDKLIQTRQINCFVIDFAEVPFMDSTGIGVLLGRYKKLCKLGIPFVEKTRSAVIGFNASGLFGIITKI